jgi:hypothetical protein
MTFKSIKISLGGEGNLLLSPMRRLPVSDLAQFARPPESVFSPKKLWITLWIFFLKFALTEKRQCKS